MSSHTTMSIQLGDSPIDFNLKGIDGNHHTLSDYQDKKLIALIFSCNHCPYVVASEREFVELQKTYATDVQLIAINSNSKNPNFPVDSYENMIKRAEEKGFNFPYLTDDDQSLARKYGAGRTPEIYLFDEDRKLRYHGRINDNPTKHDQISRHDLKEAIDELLAGKEVSVPEVPALGCGIKYMN